MKKPRFHVEIVTDTQPEVNHDTAHGYGEGAVATMLTGRTKEVTIARLQFLLWHRHANHEEPLTAEERDHINAHCQRRAKQA
jgi:hypothetical protein